MCRFVLAVSVWCLLPTVVSAEIMSSHQQVIDFTQPEQAAKLATWSPPKHLGCTKAGFGWDGDKDSSRDGWIETEPLAIGTGWRPTRDAQVRLTVQTNYPSIVSTGAHSKAFYTPSIYVRHSADRVHWSDWQPTALDENPRAPGKVLYTASVGVARRMRKDYEDRHQQWARREDVAWGSDEDAFCRWLVKQEPDYFAKQRPFVGYVQFLLESSFRGNQRLTRFEADVDWGIGGLQQLAKGPTSEKRLESQNGWGFRGDEATPRKKE